MTDPDRLAQLLGRTGDRWPSAPGDWELLLSQARRARLQGRLAITALAAIDQTPAVPGADGPPGVGLPAHLHSALKVCEQVAQGMRLEAERLSAALAQAGHRCVLLKGAAYLCASLPPARGRLFGDIDILVPQAALAPVESALMAGGWISTDRDAYLQRYYRQWMHEIPPLTHVKRGSTVDVHHTIAPPTSAFQVDGQQLLAAARPVSEDGRFWMLQPVDMVLHSAVHLFAEGEFDSGLRDMLDLRDLLRHFERTESDFWPTLFARAHALGLTRPLHHALHHAERLFEPIVPLAHQAAARAITPARLPRYAMQALLVLALRPNHPGCDQGLTGLARWVLYLRSHWLRMPLSLLLPHLVRKAWLRRFPDGLLSPARAVPPR